MSNLKRVNEPEVLTETEMVRKGDGTPVVLLHGIYDTARKMERLAGYFRSRGRNAYPFSVAPSSGEVGLEILAAQLQGHIERTFPAGQRIDLVGFSMGGLICRYYLQRLGGLGRVRRFVTISTPHRGSLLAWLVENPACRQMRPGSRFLRDLASDVGRLAVAGFTSLWTPFDLMILPANSSVIPEARCKSIWCIGHSLMVWDERSFRAVAAALEDGGV